MTLISFIKNRTVETTNEEKKTQSFRKNLAEYCLEFSDNTTIHGLKYLGERKRSLIEKFWWLIIFLISVTVCVILIINTWIKWDQSPVLLSFAPVSAKVWQIPFPAVTVCPENKIDSTIYNYSSSFYSINILSDTEHKKFCQASFMCGYPIDSCVKTKDDITVDAQFATKIGPSMEKSLAYCTWKHTVGCEYLFSPIIINNGLCFSFNMLDKRELFKDNYFIHHKSFAKHRNMTGWSPEKGYYSNELNQIIFPRKALLAESSESLEFVVLSNKTIADFMCSKATEGFKLYLHHPSEIPGVGIHYLRIPMDKVVDIVIKPNMVYTSEELKGYSPSRRKCYMAKEKELQFFKMYNKQNCLTECIANYTLKTCGCVPYYMPHEQSTQLCGSKDYICTASIEQTLLTFDIQSSYNKSFEDPLTQCDCLPNCSTLKYEAELSQTDLTKFENFQTSRIKIFFKDMEFIPIERKELFGTTDFWANCGGLLGLFMGFSLLSLIEMIYFFTLRLMCNLKQYGRNNWSGSNN